MVLPINLEITAQYQFESEWISDYLFNRKQLIIYNNTLSESGLLTCCVSKGSILGPLLFIIFANDIVNVLRNSRIIKYADDTVIYVAGNNIEINDNYQAI